MTCPDKLTFAAAVRLEGWDNPEHVTFAVDRDRRTIRGLAVPYGTPGRSLGEWWQFSDGSIRWNPDHVNRVKLLIGHDFSRTVGVVTELESRPGDGLYFTARVVEGAEGDHALSMVASGAWDGVSIGIQPGVRYTLNGDVRHATEADLGELSLTPMPSFSDARVHSVAASAEATERNTPMTPEQRARLAELMLLTSRTTEQEREFSDLSALAVTFAADTANTATGEPVEFDATGLTQAVATAVAAGFAGASKAVPGRESIDPTGTQLDEAPLYRFDGIGGQRGFVADIIAANNGDSEARRLLAEHMDAAAAHFAVTTAGAGSLNPTQNRPELYVPNLTYARPLWEAVTTGTLEDKTPFTIPKFGAASGLVSNHTEGDEPTPGSFNATSQTVTPGGVSGKIELNREVIDAGGSPQADQIIWSEMLNAYYEAIEARIAAILSGVTTTAISLAGAEDGALVNELKSYFAGLQFVRGGNRFTRFASNGALFSALVDAQDTAGRSLLPVLGPNNSDGQTAGGFDAVKLGTQDIKAAWALGTAGLGKSYSFVPTSVYAWASAPKQFRFEYQVKSVDIGIWGYGAEAVTRQSDVQPIIHGS